MRVVHVCPMLSYHGGVERHVFEISKRLQKAGVDVEVYTTDPTGKLPKHGYVDEIPLRRFRSLAPNRAYFFAPKLYSALKELQNIDIVHTHSYQAFPSLFVALAKKKNKIPFVFTPHYHPMGGTSLRTFLRKTYRTVGKQIFKQANVVIAVSKYEQKLLTHLFKESEEKVVYIPNGIDLEKFINLTARHKNSQKKSILYVGRLEKYKGVHYLMKAFLGVLKKYPFSELNIVGSGSYALNFVSLAKDLKISRSTHFLGSVQEATLLQLYASSDIFAILSEYEAFCISLVEAMASGLPAIASRVGGIPEIIQDGYNGFLIDYPPDHHDLTGIMIRLIEQEDLAFQVGANARKTVLTSFSWDETIKHLLELYAKVLDGHEILSG